MYGRADGVIAIVFTSKKPMQKATWLRLIISNYIAYPELQQKIFSKKWNLNFKLLNLPQCIVELVFFELIVWAACCYNSV